MSIHRGRLQRILYDAALARVGADVVVIGHRLTRFSVSDHVATATFAALDGRERAEEADLIIAADGIHSAARRQMYPDEGAPVYSGSMHWRGTTRAPSFLSGRSMFMAGYSATKFVAYPITMPDADGRQQINWIAEIQRPKPLNREDWNRPGRLEDFLPAFEDWRFDWLDVPALVAAFERVSPSIRWSTGIRSTRGRPVA